MKTDFDNVLPIYNVAKEYQILQREDAELEVFSTLVAVSLIFSKLFKHIK